MNARTGLAVAILAAFVSVVITAGGLWLYQSRAPIAVSQGKVATESQIETVIANYMAQHPPVGLDLNKPAVQKKLTAFVHAYLVKNPEILVDMTNVLDKRQKAAAAAAQKKAIADNAKALFHSPYSFVAGNLNGKVSVVEFFDYNCPYCKRALPDVVRLTQKDHDVRVVLKELPIFGKDSEDASRVALAVMKDAPSDYFELHQRLFEDPGKADMAKALNIVKQLGLNVAQIKKDMHAPSVDAALKQNARLAEALNLRGTPFYLVGDQVVNGAPSNLFEVLQKHVKEAAQKG